MLPGAQKWAADIKNPEPYGQGNESVEKGGSQTHLFVGDNLHAVMHPA